MSLNRDSSEMVDLPTLKDYDESYFLHARGTLNIFQGDVNYDLTDSADDDYNFQYSYWDMVVSDLYYEVGRITALANKILELKKGMQKVFDLYWQAYSNYLLGGYVFPDGTAYEKKNIDNLLNNNIQKAIDCIDTIYCGLCQLRMAEIEKLMVARHQCRLAHNNRPGELEYDDF